MLKTNFGKEYPQDKHYFANETLEISEINNPWKKWHIFSRIVLSLCKPVMFLFL